MILLVAFGALLLISFGVTALLLTATKSQKLVDRRILAILMSGTQTSSGEPLEQQLLKLDPANKFRWLNTLLQKYHVSKRLKIRIIQADIKTTPAMILVTSAVLTVVGFVGVSISPSDLFHSKEHAGSRPSMRACPKQLT